MATTRVMTTVLPYSVDPNDPFHVSLFFSHRLEGGGSLADYAIMADWVGALRIATFQLHTDTSPAPIACTPLLTSTGDPRIVAPSESAWRTAFPGDSAVRDFPTPDLTGVPWNSFPANRTPDHALEAHYASTCSCPVSRPSVLSSPLARELLDTFGNLTDLVGLLDTYLGDEDTRGSAANHRKQLNRNADQAARDAVTPTIPQAQIVEPPGAVIREAPTASGSWKSPIELLLDPSRADVDQKITEFLDDLVDNPLHANTPILRMLADVHAAQRYYRRAEERVSNQDPPPALPIPGAQEQSTPHDVPDFHERAATACNVPALARSLGFVVDVHVDDLDALRTATRIRCDAVFDRAEQILPPETLCTTDGLRFLAVAQTERWKSGRLGLGDPSHYRVMDLDPDAAGLSLEQLLRSVIRALAIKANGDRNSFAPAALRSTGFSIAELDRPVALRERVTTAQTRKLEPSGSQEKPEQFHFEDLLRGTRIEVWDDVTKVWHNLHERRVNASFDESQILTGVHDTGYLQNPPMSGTPGSDAHPYYVHEVLAGWDGWSLSAPRPGRLVLHDDDGTRTGDDGTQGPAGSENITDKPDVQNGGLRVQSVVEPASLPAMRYGRRYSFRIAGVDLAGNSVPMAAPAPEADPAAVDAASAHLDALRTEAAQRDSQGLLAELKAKGTARPRSRAGDGDRGEIERAATSVVDNASSLRMHPQWEVDPAEFAVLFSDSGDPNTVSSPRQFLRWGPLPAPVLVPRVRYTAGESLQRMVIRTGLTGAPGLCERHMAPPKGSQLEAEQDGRFDELMRTGEHARAYATALKERGNLFNTRIQDLNSPTGTVAQPGVSLLAAPNATDLKTLEEIQDPEVQPAEGQYIVHDVDQLVLPYLPDAFAAGVALVFYEAGADHQFDNARVLQSVTLKFAGEWPEVQPLRLVLHTAPRLDARQDGNVIHVGLPPGEQVAVAFSTTLDAEHLDKMALWRFHPVHDPNVPEADRLILERAARNGWLWWLTPDEHLRLVHATARPAVAPAITRLTAQPRTPNVVTANLDGVIDVHGASTDKVELRARWDDLIDDPANAAPTVHGNKEIVVAAQIREDETVSLLTLQENAEVVGGRMSEVNIRTAIHNLPDTKARTVHYRLHGSSRFREFFLPDELPGPDDEASAGDEVAVNIPSSSAPAPPVLHDVIPMFKWEQTNEPEHPLAVRRTRRSGVRIWLDRPWYSSGDGEMLAILTTGSVALANGHDDKVSLWARDPILVGPALKNTYEVPLLSAWQQRAAQLALPLLEEPARPVGYVVRERLTDPAKNPTVDTTLNAYLFRPEFHPERRRWFVDVLLQGAHANWPFLRLSVARYQPNSIPGQEFSEIVATDFVQLPPERIATLSRPEAGEVRISVTGVNTLTNGLGVTLPVVAPQDDDATRNTKNAERRKTITELLTKSRRVVATLQGRNAASGSDIEWVDIAEVQCELAGIDSDTFGATWSAALPLSPELQLLTPGSSQDLRVQVEEYEWLPADPATRDTEIPSNTERLVYADHLGL